MHYVSSANAVLVVIAVCFSYLSNSMFPPFFRVLLQNYLNFFPVFLVKLSVGDISIYIFFGVLIIDNC